jgi:DNA adenine methylase
MDSPLCYIGGKSRLSDIISQGIPEHKSYCEVFAGAAWVFFRKEPSKYEFLNDLDGNLIAFYRVVQNHLEEFLRQFKWLLSSHEWWDDWNKQLEAGGLTDIQKAARYYYVQRHSFAGKVAGKSWGTGADRLPRINLLRLEEEMSQVHLRLSRVTIENLDYQTFIKRYDKPDTFFYLDPPYYKCPFYRFNFYSLDDFKNLATILSSISGKFIMSINDHSEIRAIFKDFGIRGVRVPYSAGVKHAKRNMTGHELLISNF